MSNNNDGATENVQAGSSPAAGGYTAPVVEGELAAGPWGISLKDLRPSITFVGENYEYVGELWVEDGEIHFEGDADEAAQVFFTHALKPMVDEYLKSKGAV